MSDNREEPSRSESTLNRAAREVGGTAVRHTSHFLLLTAVAIGVLAGQFFLFSDTQLPEELRYPHYIAATVIVGVLLYLAFSRFVHRTLQVKLTVGFIMVASVPITFLAALDQRVAYEALTQNTRRALLGAASQTASSLDAFLSTTLDTIRTESLVPVLARFLSMPPETRKGSEEEIEVAGTLNAFRGRDSEHISSYALLDERGFSVVDTYGPEGADKSSRNYFTIPLQTGRP
jgi:hypothetical protein